MQNKSLNLWEGGSGFCLLQFSDQVQTLGLLSVVLRPEIEVVLFPLSRAVSHTLFMTDK